MPRRFNYTERQKINREDITIRLVQHDGHLSFDADLRFAGYGLDSIQPPPQVFVEAYRGASTLWRRFDFGRISTLQPPDDRSLDEFAVPQGILFRVKVTATGQDALGRLVAEADVIHPQLPCDQDSFGLPLIQHMPANDIGDELWRTDFSGNMPLLKINSRVPVGVDQFLSDPQYRAVFAPAVMRQVLTRILIIDRDSYDPDDSTCWQARWLNFAGGLSGIGECPEAEAADGRLTNLEELEIWIDEAVTEFACRAALFAGFSRATSLDLAA